MNHSAKNSEKATPEVTNQLLKLCNTSSTSVPHRTNLGQNIRTAREALDLTQLELAHRIGMQGANAGAYISRAETGEITPRIDTLSKIAKVLETDVHQLIPRMG